MRSKPRTRVAWRPLPVILGLALILTWPVRAAAHPLGNFSINHYSALRLSRDGVEIRYIVDLAEIPTFQEMQEQEIGPASDQKALAQYLGRKAAALQRNLVLILDDRRLPLEAMARGISFPAGAGDLPTLRMTIDYKARVALGAAAGNRRLFYSDNNFPERQGWKEIIVQSGQGINLRESSVPERDRSNALNDYPADLLNSPPQNLQAQLQFTAAPAAPAPRPAVIGGGAATGTTSAPAMNSTRESESARAAAPSAPQTATAPAPPSNPRTPRDAFTEIIAARQQDWQIFLLALAVAMGLGALHALEPGHGKALVAAYLVGSRGTLKHAVVLGSIVTVAHTAAVYLLGGVTLYASNYIVPEQLYPWLTLASGLTVVALGGLLLLRRWQGASALHQHSHDHSHDHHDADHHHHHHHALPDQEEAITLKQLVSLGLAGGIVPCPAALVVLLSAVTLHRIGFGLLLIVAFSIGLAAVLIGLGIVMIYAHSFAARFTSRGSLTSRWLPLASSAFIMLFGLALTWQAVGQLP